MDMLRQLNIGKYQIIEFALNAQAVVMLHLEGFGIPINPYISPDRSLYFCYNGNLIFFTNSIIVFCIHQNPYVLV